MNIIVSKIMAESLVVVGARQTKQWLAAIRCFSLLQISDMFTIGGQVGKLVVLHIGGRISEMRKKQLFGGPDPLPTPPKPSLKPFKINPKSLKRRSRGPRGAPETAKSAQGAPKRRPRGTQEAPKSAQELPTVAQESPRCAQEPPNPSQNRAKGAPKARSGRFVGGLGGLCS